MDKDLGVPPSGSGHSAEPEPQGVSAQGASVPNAERVQRWFRRFDSAPRDGTPFAMPCIYRFNPVGGHFEALCVDPETGKLAWRRIAWTDGNKPNWWCPLPPLSFELPSPDWFAYTWTMTYVVRPKTRWERLCDWLAIKLLIIRLWRPAVPTGDAPKGGDHG